MQVFFGKSDEPIGLLSGATQVTKTPERFNTENQPHRKTAFRKFAAENNFQLRAAAQESLVDQFETGILQQRVQRKEIDPNTLIHRAIIEKSSEVLAFLLRHKVNVDYPDANGMSPLTIAILTQQSEIVKLLLNNGASINPQKKWNDMSLLEISMKARDLESMRYLIAYGSDIEQAFKTERDPFRIYFNDRDKSGNWDLLKTALESQNLSSFWLDKAFVCAAWSNSAYFNAETNEVIVYLIERGANVNIRSGFALAAACEPMFGADKDRIQILLSHGADPNLYSENELSPLIKVTGNLDIMELLIKYGANPNQVSILRDPAGKLTERSALVQAIRYGLPSTALARVKLLVEAGADLNKKIDGSSPLEHAFQTGRMDVVRYLLELSPSA